MSLSLLRTLLPMSLTLALAPAGFGSSIITTGFEPGEGFVTGNPNGQNGWVRTGTYDSAISNAGARSGTQSLRISNAITSTSFSDHLFSPSVIPGAGEASSAGGGLVVGPLTNLFSMSFYFRPVLSTVQHGLAVVLSPDRGDGARMSWLQLADDTTNGLQVNFYDAELDGSFAPTSTNLANNLDRNTWHHLQLVMSFVDGPDNDVVQVFLNGTLVHTGGSWEQFFRVAQGPNTRPVDSILFRPAGPARPEHSGNGFFIDDLSFTSVPEPSTYAMALAALVAVAGLRRRQ